MCPKLGNGREGEQSCSQRIPISSLNALQPIVLVRTSMRLIQLQCVYPGLKLIGGMYRHVNNLVKD